MLTQSLCLKLFRKLTNCIDTLEREGASCCEVDVETILYSAITLLITSIEFDYNNLYFNFTKLLFFLIFSYHYFFKINYFIHK